MLFSCKITHSLLTSLDRRGEDISALYEKCDWPAEFLRDASSWLEADKMEQLLRGIDADYGRLIETDQPLMVAVGHQSKDLRSWGVLDSVLRMVQTSKDLFAQPERFLSYFVSPAPPIGEIKRGPDFVSFVLPVSEQQFPLVTSYLRAALEALPTYIHKPMANVKWEDSRVTISWSEAQESLFGEADADLSLHPELVRNIFMNLETSQKELDETKKLLLASEAELESMKSRATPTSVSPSAAAFSSPLHAAPGVFTAGVGESVATTLHELYRLGDYFARSQQLVTLLVAQGRATPQVQEAMRRVDWTFVCEAAPLMIRKAINELQEVQEQVRVEVPANTTTATAPAQVSFFPDQSESMRGARGLTTPR